ncbi:AMIN domain-containing protein [Leptolyngbya sp. BL0902]|uniref:AMIN domain-containing protein n=1 Tax=Leptolyngbya sp. BL0902 TaxID=1115757 RepID=UPI001CECABCA|nr:AMIN domain-containing protein [Leptolyngbya sp. BL0902]
MSGALLALVASPATAAASITNVRLNPTAQGLDLVFDTEGGNGDVFTVHQGNTLRADLTRTQLNLPEGELFQQENPAPGIASVSVVPLDANSVRVTIEGTDQAPVSQINSRRNRVVLSLRPDGETRQAPTPVPDTLVTVPGPETPPALAQAAEPIPVMPPPAQPDVLVPNPEVVIDGVPVPRPQLQQAPPFLPRAVAPPVGDMSFAETTIIPFTIDLGTNERIPRLLLRDAPAREVLGLLARAAGMNLVFAPGTAGSSAPGEGNSDTLVSLDIENESVQDVFNHVLRISGLQANRVGRSIYVGPRLPDGARSLVSRTLRLNQAGAVQAAGFLASLGAEATQLVTRPQIETVSIEGSDENTLPITRVLEFDSTQIVPLTFSPPDDSQVATPLRGLQVVTDDRLNSITLIGETALVNLASEYVTRLDLRRRQVAVNVKIIDINLSAIDRFGTSFSTAVGDLGIINTGGAGVINFGGRSPAGVPSPIAPGGITSVNPGASLFSIPSQILVQIQAQVSSGNGKILTDPTLIVQEGQAASVNLTQDVVTDITSTVSTSTPPVITTTVDRTPAGLTLNLQVERIDDNGFVTLNVAPRVTSLTGSQTINTAAGANVIGLLSTREVSSGSIRLRDGQTLLLTGIIQESERTDVSKVPILGDIPILGALFRSETTTSSRNEVLVMVTPQVLDDSDQAIWGYRYTPSEQVQEILENPRR